MTVQVSDHRIESGRPGLSLHVRRKSGADAAVPLLMVHGATYPSSVMFDYPVEGTSWMDWLAARGFDVWCVDLLGYGLSDRPPEMSVPAADNSPIVDTAEAVGDVKRVMDFVLGETGQSRLDLLGYSWGTAICGQIAGYVPDRINRLILSGALWLRSGNVQIQVPGPLGAYRMVTADATIQRWCVNLTDDQKAALGSADDRAAWGAAAVASDPDSGRHDPPQLRAPTGVVKDVTEGWLKGAPTYDPGRITAPTLVAVGEWDQETTPEQGLEVFKRLTGSTERRFSMIGGGTHSLLLEAQRHQLYNVVEGFLRD